MSHAAADIHGAPRARTVARLLTLRARGGFEVAESRAHGLLDPAIPVSDALRDYCSMRQVRRIQRSVNPAEYRHLIDDKWDFADACAQRGLPTARTVALFAGPEPGRRADGSAVPDDDAWRSLLASDPAEGLVVKPVGGRNGTGVRVLRREGDELTEGGAALSADRLVAELREAGGRFVIQERVRDHPDLQRINVTEALQTVRVITYATADGVVDLIVAVLKLPRRTATVDNYEGGRAGTVQAFLDPGPGTIREAWAPREGGVGAVPVERHPETGVTLVGAQVPRWEETRDLALRATAAFAPLRTIGWDIAITESGPVLIEGNLPWDPIPLRDGGGRFRRMATGPTGA